MDSIVVLRWLEALIPPVTFLLIMGDSMEPEDARWRPETGRMALFLGVTALQILLAVWGFDFERIVTIFPLTWYLPGILFLLLFSKSPIFAKTVVCLFSLLSAHLLMALEKLLTYFLAGRGGPFWPYIFCGIELISAVFLLILVHFRLKEPFRSCMKEADAGWLPLLALPAMLLALYSYFLASTTDAIVLILLFFTALSSLFALLRLMRSLAEERRARDARLQMSALRQNYAVLEKKLELGRIYRHDMRHHMATLSTLLQAGDCREAQRYVADWQGQLTRTETGTWCRSAAVNAVLSDYLSRARQAGCEVEANVSLPEEFPFEEVDLCVALSNALENAVHACEAEPEGQPREIRLDLALAEGRRLTICVENSCGREMEFDGAGYPIVPRREGHGQGLRSIAAVAEKYHGLFQCDWKDGKFILRVVLLHGGPDPGPGRVHRAPAACVGVLLCLFLLNCMPPSLAQALESVPVLGQVVRVADLRTWALGWGDTGISVRDPVLEGDGPAVDELNARKDAFLAGMEEKFLWYAGQKYQGYVAQDITYDVLRDDETLFILRFSATLNAGGSVDYHRCLVLDKGRGEVLELADLFQPGANYIFPISREIRAQMEEQVRAGTGSYFLPGGIWAEEECFRSIAEDQEFYIDGEGRLVIAFAEYEVAPGSMGSPEFVIPTDVLEGLLAQPSVLQ